MYYRDSYSWQSFAFSIPVIRQRPVDNQGGGMVLLVDDIIFSSHNLSDVILIAICLESYGVFEE